MNSLQALLDAPAVRPLLRSIAGPGSDAPVRRIALVEDLARIEELDEATVAVLTHAASVDAASYRLDVALRTAGSRRRAARTSSGPAFSAVDTGASAGAPAAVRL